jgi:uncharacterized protein YacL
MLNILWIYLFIGTIVGLLLETMVRMSYNSVNMYERFWLITLWPIMLLIFLYYFFKHLFFNIDDE